MAKKIKYGQTASGVKRRKVKGMSKRRDVDGAPMRRRKRT